MNTIYDLAYPIHIWLALSGQAAASSKQAAAASSKQATGCKRMKNTVT
jgi:hypothetical protein